MNFELLLKEAPDLDPDIDSMKQMMPSISLPGVDVMVIRNTWNNVCFNLASMFEAYSMATQLTTINKVDGVNNLVYITNLHTGAAIKSYIEFMNNFLIDFPSMVNYYEKMLEDKKLKDTYFFEDKMIQTVLGFARYNNIMGMIYNNPEINLRPRHLPKDVDDQFIKAGRILNPILLDFVSRDLWQLTCYGSLALGRINNLKEAHLKVMEGWLYLMKVMDMMGHNWDSLGRVYSVYKHYKLKPENYATEK